MKVDAFISHAVAFETFGIDYVGHFKCGSCRYVVRMLGAKFIIAKEYGSSGRFVSEQVTEPFLASSNIGAIEVAEGLIKLSGAGVDRLIALGNAEPLN